MEGTIERIARGPVTHMHGGPVIGSSAPSRRDGVVEHDGRNGDGTEPHAKDGCELCAAEAEAKLTSIHAVEDVTDEIIELVNGVVEGWYSEGRIDWSDVWDRVEGAELEDGTELDLGTDLGSPALNKLKREILKLRKQWG